jgi:hypothetical protein
MLDGLFLAKNEQSFLLLEKKDAFFWIYKKDKFFIKKIKNLSFL